MHACRIEPLPILIGGDYSIIRNPDEKSNNRYNDKSPFLFNAIINSLDLRELDLSGRKYQWRSCRNVVSYGNCNNSTIFTHSTNFIASLECSFSSSNFLCCNGYMVPEYLMRGEVSTNTNILSFGVIIIHIITGRRYHPHSDVLYSKHASEDNGIQSIEHLSGHSQRM